MAILNIKNLAKTNRDGKNFDGYSHRKSLYLILKMVFLFFIYLRSIILRVASNPSASMR